MRMQGSELIQPSMMCLAELSAMTGESLVQVQGSPGFPVQYASTLDCVRQMYAQEGICSFWR